MPSEPFEVFADFEKLSLEWSRAVREPQTIDELIMRAGFTASRSSNKPDLKLELGIERLNLIPEEARIVREDDPVFPEATRTNFKTAWLIHSWLTQWQADCDLIETDKTATVFFGVDELEDTGSIGVMSIRAESEIWPRGNTRYHGTWQGAAIFPLHSPVFFSLEESINWGFSRAQVVVFILDGARALEMKFAGSIKTIMSDL